MRELLWEQLLEDKRRGESVALPDEESRFRVAELEKSNREILSTYPPHQMAVSIHERLVARRIRKWRVLGPILAVTACALVIGLMGLQPPQPSQRLAASGVAAETASTRVKGDPMLLVYRQGDGSVPLSAGATARVGDVLQIRFNSSTATHAMVVSVDGRGVVTAHFPVDGAQSDVKPRTVYTLGSAYQLDDAPGFEQFFLIWTDEGSDIDQSAVIRLLRSGRTGELKHPRWPEGVHAKEFVIRKVPWEDHAN